jgi:transposase
MEAVLASQSVWCIRGVLSNARRIQRDGAFGTVLR